MLMNLIWKITTKILIHFNSMTNIAHAETYPLADEGEEEENKELEEWPGFSNEDPADAMVGLANHCIRKVDDASDLD